MTTLRNETRHKFVDITSEEFREYTFPCGVTVRIEKPSHLAVSKSGGHRVLGEDGCFYIPPGWIALRWVPTEGAPHFVA
jgi:hypothetical protein